MAGTLIFLPVYLFWGGLFSFSVTATDSFWAWGFGIVACWCQILAMLTSFFNPRKAAYWMLVNTAVSIMLAAGYITWSAGALPHAPSPIGLWPYTGSGLFKAGMIFWAPPLVFARLLLRRNPNREDAVIESDIKPMTTSANR